MDLNLNYSQLLKLIKRLPLDLQLKLRSELDISISQEPEQKRKMRKSGSLKGFIKQMDSDFDEPLDDMKDYM